MMKKKIMSNIRESRHRALSRRSSEDKEESDDEDDNVDNFGKEVGDYHRRRDESMLILARVTRG